MKKQVVLAAAVLGVAAAQAVPTAASRAVAAQGVEFRTTTFAAETTGSDMVTTVNYHRYAKQSSAELIAEGAIS